MAKSLVYESIEIFADGTSKIRVRKTVAEGDEVYFSEPHIHVVDGNESAAQCIARLEACLTDWPTLSDEDKARIDVHLPVMVA